MLGKVDELAQEVIISNPRYPCYQNFIHAAGGKLKGNYSGDRSQNEKKTLFQDFRDRKILLNKGLQPLVLFWRKILIVVILWSCRGGITPPLLTAYAASILDSGS